MSEPIQAAEQGEGDMPARCAQDGETEAGSKPLNNQQLDLEENFRNRVYSLPSNREMSFRRLGNRMGEAIWEHSIDAEDIDAQSLLYEWVSPPPDIYGLLVVFVKTGNLFPLMIQKCDRFKKWDLGLGTDFTHDSSAHLYIFFTVCLCTFCTQCLLLWYIWKDLSALRVSAFCDNSTFLQVMVITLVVVQFALILIDPFNCLRIFNESTTRFVLLNEKADNGRLYLYPCTNLSQKDLISLLCHFLFGFLSYGNFAYAVVGVRYILQQDGASNIIQACVALQFILDIDNQVKAKAGDTHPLISIGTQLTRINATYTTISRYSSTAFFRSMVSKR